jgi:hypothetical protein
VTNLDVVEYLLEAGADPNAQDHIGKIPLMYTIADTPGAAKCMLNWWPTYHGRQSSVVWRGVAWRGVAWRGVAWRGVEERLVERGALDNGITALEPL